MTLAIEVRCTAFKADGSRCRSTILHKGGPTCRQHSEDAGKPKRQWSAAEAYGKMREPTESAFVEEGWAEDPYFDVRKCARRFKVSEQSAYNWRWWVRYRLAIGEEKDAWIPPGDFPDHWMDLTSAHLDRLVEDFTDFRARYFRSPRRQPFFTPSFMRNWIRAILKALVTGGRLSILSPPRHGKTELLIHFAVWLICRWPDIQIVWCGGNERIAQRSVGAVAQHLAQNQELIDTYAGPGGSFRPKPKTGLPWSKSEFTVANRRQPEKGRTMTALGRGGTLLSLDASILIADDIEDHGSTVQAGSRESTRDWWTSQFESRKEEDTALFNIGSRQHSDDLAGHLLENDAYETIVETMHSFDCELPEDDFDAHVDCMLFAELRSYRYFRSQRKASEAGGGEGVFDMVYLNRAGSDGLQVFSKEIVHQCRSPVLVAGQMPTVKVGGVSSEGSGLQLVAGLDPAGTAGYQAAILVAFQIEPKPHVWIVDVENRRGGGIPAFAEIVRGWWEKYRVSHWVVESNLYHGAMSQDRDVREFAQYNGIRLEDFQTHLNKTDPRIGVTAMQPMFANSQITIPWGDEATVEKMDVLRRQLINWDGTAPRNRNKTGLHTDLVMALWFAWGVFRRSRMDWSQEAVFLQDDSGYQISQWDVGDFETAEMVPW